MAGLIAKKVGMTQIFSKEGTVVPVTLLQVGPCFVTQKKTKASDGYDAVQVGYQLAKEKNLSNAQKGHLKKTKKNLNYLKEFPTQSVDQYEVGDELNVAHLAVGDLLDLSGISKGKGFQGVMKRHHFAGGAASHGNSITHRMPGSIGQNTYPGKVFKGKKMGGRMGGKALTIKSAQIVQIEIEDNIILVRGSVPGAGNSLVYLKPVDSSFEERVLAAKQPKEKVEDKKTEQADKAQKTEGK